MSLNRIHPILDDDDQIPRRFLPQSPWDTDWRAILVNATVSHLAGITLCVRRVGDRVQLQTFQSAAGTSTTGDVLVTTLPVGFRLDSPSGMTTLAAGIVIDSSSGIHVAGSSIYTNTAGEVYIAAVSGKRHSCTLSFITNDDWPTTLPGSAA